MEFIPEGLDPGNLTSVRVLLFNYLPNFRHVQKWNKTKNIDPFYYRNRRA